MRKIIVVIITLFIAAGCGDDFKTEDLTEFDKLDWMQGIWQGKQGNADLYESWRPLNFRIIEGVSFTTQKGKRLFGQSMRLEQSNNVIYLTLTTNNGEDQVTLKLSDADEKKAIFENEEDESFPQKVIYEKTGEKRMSVTMIGTDESNLTKLNYRKTSDV